MARLMGRVERLAAGLPSRYAFKSLIGKGSAAFVVLADDREKDIEVAIKILQTQFATVVGSSRFRRETEILRGLDHPNILPLLDHGTVGKGNLFLVTPYVVGENLGQRLKREKQLATGEAISIATTVASALDYAHGRGLIHRDIKPPNILLSDSRVVLADFGIARPVATDSLAQITLSGVALGTPHYMSPEQIVGDRELDGRTDVYSLGCVVYEMLAGRPPFTGKTHVEIFRGHRKEPPRPITEIRPKLPVLVDAAVMKSLAKDRDSRFQSAGEFAATLSEAAR